MKTYTKFILISGLIFCLPGLIIAQWGPVRFDSLNYFTNTVALSSDSTISIGVENPGVSSFLLRTTNSGNTWDSISVSSPGSDIEFQSLNFINNNDGFAGGSKNGLQCLMFTNDNGTTWSEITPDALSPDPINAISFINSLNGFASSVNTVYKTTDGGISWTAYNPGFEIFDVKFSDVNTGYIGGQQFPYAVIFKTTDGGSTWNSVFSFTDNSFIYPTIQKLDVLSSSEVVAMRQYTNTLFKTVNGGLSWDTITVSAVFSLVDFDFSDFTSGHVVSGLSEIYNTTDGGITWSLEYAAASGAYGPNVYLNSISFMGDIGFVCGSNGLVKKHDDTPTSIVESEVSAQWDFYPNPVKKGDQIYFNNVKDDLVIEVYTVSGLLIQNSFIQNFDTDVLLPGIYFIRRSDDTGMHKLVVLD